MRWDVRHLRLVAQYILLTRIATLMESCKFRNCLRTRALIPVLQTTTSGGIPLQQALHHSLKHQSCNSDYNHMYLVRERGPDLYVNSAMRPMVIVSMVVQLICLLLKMQQIVGGWMKSRSVRQDKTRCKTMRKTALHRVQIQTSHSPPSHSFHQEGLDLPNILYNCNLVLIHKWNSLKCWIKGSMRVLTMPLVEIKSQTLIQGIKNKLWKSASKMICLYYYNFTRSQFATENYYYNNFYYVLQPL